jgi:putative lipoprotein
MQKLVWSALGIGLLIVGCSGGYSNKDDSSPNPESDSNAPSAEAAPGIVLGTVTYRERIALPEDGEAYLWIVDTTPGIITTQVVVAEVTVQSGGKQVPISFTLPYDPTRIAPDHDYGLRAVIRSKGKSMFETKDATAVITKGRPVKVDLVLTRVAE